MGRNDKQYVLTTMLYMNTARYLIASVAFATLLLAGGAQAKGAWEGFPPPPDSTVQIVADYIKMNGIPQSIKTFNSERRVDEVIRFYQRVWDEEGAGKPQLSEFKDEKIITKGGEEFIWTVQTKPKVGGGSTGFMSVIFFAQFDGKGPPPGEGVPKPAGSIVYNDMASDDGPKRARTIVLQNDYSVDYNARFYQSSYRFDGWVMAEGRITEDGRSASYIFRRGTSEASVIISDKVDKTGVLLNITSPK